MLLFACLPSLNRPPFLSHKQLRPAKHIIFNGDDNLDWLNTFNLPFKRLTLGTAHSTHQPFPHFSPPSLSHSASLCWPTKPGWL